MAGKSDDRMLTYKNNITYTFYPPTKKLLVRRNVSLIDHSETQLANAFGKQEDDPARRRRKTKDVNNSLTLYASSTPSTTSSNELELFKHDLCTFIINCEPPMNVGEKDTSVSEPINTSPEVSHD